MRNPTANQFPLGCQRTLTRFSILLTLIAFSFAVSALGKAVVLPPGSAPYGKTYAEWSAEHWKWTYALPADQHPLTDSADVSAGQSGPVWFIGGTWAATDLNGNLVGIANRQVTVPAGKALFFPIIDAEASTVEGNGTSEAELRAAAAYLADHAVGLSCTLDGEALGDLEAYRVSSPLFTFGPLPANNLLSLGEGTTSPAVSDGYFVMLAPLSAGEHSIHFTGAFVFTQADDGFDFSFTLDITYDLLIK